MVKTVDGQLVGEGQPGSELPPEQYPPTLSRPIANTPSEAAQREHYITHIPFQPWCPVCVGARGRSDHHRINSGIVTTLIPLVGFDFCFLRAHRGSHTMPVLVLVDKDSGCLAALPLPSKSTQEPWMATYVVKVLQYFGHHGSIILKGDRKHAVMDLLHQVARLRGGRTHIEKNALGDSQGNGLAERGCSEHSDDG